MLKFLFWLIFILFIGGSAYTLGLIFNKRRKGHLGNLLGMSLFLIRLPKHQKKTEGEATKNFKENIAKIEQFYANISTLKRSGWNRFIYGSPRITVEIANTINQEEVGFYISVPRSFASQAKKYLQGIYADAEISPCASDYNPFVPQGYTVGGYLRFENSQFLPINTYQSLSVDPLAQITNTLSIISPEEGGAVQLIIKPASKKWTSGAKETVKAISEGRSFKEASKSISLLGGVANEATELAKMKGKEEENPVQKEVDQIALENVKYKTQKVLFEVNFRILASSKNKESANKILDSLIGVFGQYELVGGNAFKYSNLKKQSLKRMFYNFSLRAFNDNETIILNSEELASLYHLSTENLKTPKIKTLKSIKTEIPVELPSEGPVLLGEASFRDETKKVFFASDKDRRRHTYIIGQTGTGKTSLLREMIRHDIEAGRGVAVIDPHGDLIEDTLANIPESRRKDVVLFEPHDIEHPAGLNMLEYDTEEQKDFAVQEMITIFQKLFPPEVIGPMFEHYMRNAMLALMTDKSDPGTLVEIPRIFTDDKFMEEKLSKVQDPIVRQFWEKEWKKTTSQTRSDMLGYVVSKIGRFIENGMMRNIIGQSHSKFDLAKIMDEGKIFLANLSKGQTGEVNSSLLGLILVSKFQMAAMKRGSIPEEQRKDFYLYADEFQNFTTDSIPTILSEARKYKLNLILSHQFIAQLQDNIKDAVFGNVGSILSFRVGVEDAEKLGKQFAPQFERQDIINLPNFESIVKLMINGQVSSAFRMKSIKPSEGNREQIQAIKDISKQKYACSKGEVEKDIIKRANLDTYQPKVDEKTINKTN